MNNNKNGEKEPDTGYVAAYDAAQRHHARLAVESVVARRQAEVFETQGKAMHHIKEFAFVGFMSVPEATEEAFEQLWRKAFHFEPPPSGQTLQKAAKMRTARND